MCLAPSVINVSHPEMTLSWGAGIAQWLEGQTRDRKVPGLSPNRNGRRMFFSRVNFLCWLLFRYPFHPHVTAVARKRSRSFCQKCRWQVAKHTYALCGFEWVTLVHGWMVYPELAPKTAAFHVAPAMQHPKSAISTPLPWILIIRTIKGYSHSFRITSQCAQWVCSRAENSAI